MKRWLAAVLLSCGLASAQAQTVVEVPTLDSGAPRPLVGHWFAASGDAARRPAVVLLHGCGGPYDGKRRLSARMRDYAAMLNAEGWHALVLDSFTSRDIKELCTQRVGTRALTQANRRLDALGALQWLAARPDVDALRLAL